MRCNPIETSLLRTCGRERLVGVIQFGSLVLGGFAGMAGLATAERSTGAFAQMPSEYRCVTRVGAWRSIAMELSPTGIRRTFHLSPNFSSGIARVMTTLLMACFLASEELALLAARGVFSKSMRSCASRLVPVFLFYYSLLKSITGVLVLRATQRISFEATDTQSVFRLRRYKEVIAEFLEGVGLMIYAMTLFPKDAPFLPQAMSERELLNRIIAVLSSLCPQALQVNSMTEGIIGLFSTVPTILLQL